MTEIINPELLNKVLNGNLKSEIPLIKIDTSDKYISIFELPSGDKFALSNKDLKNLLQKLYMS